MMQQLMTSVICTTARSSGICFIYSLCVIRRVKFSIFRMFVDSCKRLRIMKGSEAIGLGFYAPCTNSRVSNHLSLISESLPPEPSEQSSVTTNVGNRNRCSVPGILYNTNTFEGFHALDKQGLLKAEAQKVLGSVDALMKKVTGVGKEHAALCAKVGFWNQDWMINSMWLASGGKRDLTCRQFKKLVV